VTDVDLKFPLPDSAATRPRSVASRDPGGILSDENCLLAEVIVTSEGAFSVRKPKDPATNQGAVDVPF
jgi:hypothetical protein